ncbi:hypothetical protein DUNSADRAFT_4575, partial [Dunaliella salina]
MAESLARNLQRLEEAYARSPQPADTSNDSANGDALNDPLRLEEAFALSLQPGALTHDCADNGTLSDPGRLLGSGNYSGRNGRGKGANDGMLSDHSRLPGSRRLGEGSSKAAGKHQSRGEAEFNTRRGGGVGGGLGMDTDVGSGRGADSAPVDSGLPRSSSRGGVG